MLLFQMSLPLYTLPLAGLFVALSCMSGSTLEMAASSSVAAGPYHKLPDVVGCAPECGENLDTHACYRVLRTKPDGRGFSQPAIYTFESVLGLETCRASLYSKYFQRLHILSRLLTAEL